MPFLFLITVVVASIFSTPLFGGSRTVSQSVNFLDKRGQALMITNPSNRTQHVTVFLKSFEPSIVWTTAKCRSDIILGYEPNSPRWPTGTWSCSVTGKELKVTSPQLTIEPAQTLRLFLCEGGAPNDRKGACLANTNPNSRHSADGNYLPGNVGGAMLGGVITIEVAENAGALTAEIAIADGGNWSDSNVVTLNTIPINSGHPF